MQVGGLKLMEVLLPDRTQGPLPRLPIVGARDSAVQPLNHSPFLQPPQLRVKKNFLVFSLFYVCECFASMFICASDMLVLEVVRAGR